MEFVAIDVETANADMASICQIGIAKYSDGRLVDEWESLIDPEDSFDFMNISIHGIYPEMVEGAPTLPQVVDILAEYLNNSVCVCHTHFDRVSMGRAYLKYEMQPLSSYWLDSAMVARRAWPEFSRRGYGLANLCEKLGYEFEHHDALADAKACATVLLEAINQTDLDLDSWLTRVRKPIDITSAEPIKREGNPEGELFGEVAVFTGALLTPRKEAASLAASMGCVVASSVTKKTTLLVVGDQDLSKLAGKEKSSKHLKVEELNKKGQKIRILKESDFEAMVHQYHACVDAVDGSQKKIIPKPDPEQTIKKIVLSPEEIAWRKNRPVSESQIIVCKFLELQVPDRSTHDQVEAVVAEATNGDLLKQEVVYTITEVWKGLANPKRREYYYIKEVVASTFIGALQSIGYESIREEGLDDEDLVEAILEIDPDLSVEESG